MGRLRGRGEGEGGTLFLEAVGQNWDRQISGCMPEDLECSDGRGEPKNVQRLSKLSCSAFLPLPSPTWENEVRINQSSRLLRDGG